MARHIPGSVLILLGLLTLSLPSIGQQTIGGQRGRFSVMGTVRDPGTSEGLEDVVVELRQFSGPIADEARTDGHGNFIFYNLPSSTYNLVVDRTGYEHIDQQISVTSNLTGVQLELRRTVEPSIAGSQVISARELSVPRKAHDEMQKGMSLLYQKSDYKGSVAQFERAARDFSGYYEAYAQMGIAYEKMGDVANSEASFRKSIELSKERYPDAYFMLANILTGRKQFAEAESPARKAVELNASSWQAQFELARALYGLNKLDEAEQSAAAAAQLRSDEPDVYLLLANIHGRTRNLAKLVEDLNAFLKLDPTSPQAEQARKARAEILAGLDRPAGTSSEVRPVGQQTP